MSGENSGQQRPIRILLIGASMDILGGHAVFAQRHLAAMREDRSFELQFLPINPRLPGPLRCLQGVKYVRTVVTSLAYVLSLVRQIPRTDIVHALSASYFSFLVGPLPAIVLARLLGKKSVLNYHSGEAQDHLARWPLSRYAIRSLPNCIVVPSDYLVGVFREFGIAAKAIGNIVPIETIPFRPRDSPRPVLLSNRNLEPLYNVECSILAFAMVQKKFPWASMMVVGDGSQRQYLKTLATKLGLQNIQFMGRVENQRMMALYDQCDIYITTPKIDNMPLSILEAFAAGLPVVATSIGGIPYIIRDGENGLLVAGNDHEAAAARIVDLVESRRQAAPLVEAARSECLKRYVWQTVVGEWASVYRSLAEKPEAGLQSA